MQTVLLVIHVMLALAMIVTVLLQRSEGGALGIGGGGGGGAGGGLMTGRGAANLLTRTTAFLAAGFFATSITLAILAGGDRAPTSVIDSTPAQQAPAAPTGPSVPKQ
jgi:preprotein translocase subunit SecG